MPRVRLVDLQVWERRRRQRRVARQVNLYLQRLEARLAVRIAEQEHIDVRDVRLMAIRADIRCGSRALELLFHLEGDA